MSEEARDQLLFRSGIMAFGFTSAPKIVTKSPKLSLQAKAVFIMILNYAWDNATCWPGRERLAEEAGVHVNSIDKHIKELVDIGLISKSRRGKKKTNVYTIELNDDPKWIGILQPVMKVHIAQSEMPDQLALEIGAGAAEAAAAGDSGKSVKKKEVDPDKYPYERVIDYFNRRTGSNYRHTTKAYRRLIKSRIDEGYEPEDFKLVIDYMYFKWKNDPDKLDYIRPQTFFSENFESYLQAAKRNKQKTAPKTDESGRVKNEFLEQYYNN